MVEVIAGFNKAYKEANATQCRYRVLTGSAGSGKSVNVAMDYIIKLSDPQFAGSNLLVVRETEASHLTSTFAELSAAIDRLKLGPYWKITKSPLMMMSTITGSQIIFKGFSDAGAREKIKSINFPRGKLTWVWAEEATDLRFEDMQFLDDRLRGILPENLYYQITMTFNPVSAQHWIKRYYWDVDNPDIFKLRTTYLQNRFIDTAYSRRMEMRKEIDPEGYRVYGLGEWGETEGLILNNYSVVDISLVEQDYDSVVLAQDFGFNHANAILRVGFKDGNIYVLEELYVRELDTNEIIKLAHFNKKLPMFCDSAEPDRIKMWQKAGYRAQPVKKEPNSVAAQIDYLKQHRIYIHPSCDNTIKEIQQWRWQKDKTTGSYIDKPVEINDDAMAALRYSIEELRRVPKKLTTMPKQALGL